MLLIYSIWFDSSQKYLRQRAKYVRTTAIHTLAQYIYINKFNPSEKWVLRSVSLPVGWIKKCKSWNFYQNREKNPSFDVCVRRSRTVIEDIDVSLYTSTLSIFSFRYMNAFCINPLWANVWNLILPHTAFSPHSTLNIFCIVNTLKRVAEKRSVEIFGSWRLTREYS